MRKPVEERLHPMELRLTPGMLRAIDALAANTGDSRSEVVRDAVDAWRAAGAPLDGRAPGRRRITQEERIVKVTVYLLPEQVVFLDDLARQRGTTRSQLLRAAVAHYLGQDGEEGGG